MEKYSKRWIRQLAALICVLWWSETLGEPENSTTTDWSSSSPGLTKQMTHLLQNALTYTCGYDFVCNMLVSLKKLRRIESFKVWRDKERWELHYLTHAAPFPFKLVVSNFTNQQRLHWNIFCEMSTMSLRINFHNMKGLCEGIMTRIAVQWNNSVESVVDKCPYSLNSVLVSQLSLVVVKYSCLAKLVSIEHVNMSPTASAQFNT